MAHKVYGETPIESAALAEPAAVALHSVNRAGNVGPIAGRSGIIFGMGTIGLMVLQAFRAMGGGDVICNKA